MTIVSSGIDLAGKLYFMIHVPRWKIPAGVGFRLAPHFILGPRLKKRSSSYFRHVLLMEDYNCQEDKSNIFLSRLLTLFKASYTAKPRTKGRGCSLSSLQGLKPWRVFPSSPLFSLLFSSSVPGEIHCIHVKFSYIVIWLFYQKELGGEKEGQNTSLLMTPPW